MAAMNVKFMPPGRDVHRRLLFFDPQEWHYLALFGLDLELAARVGVRSGAGLDF
jgi:hypothetical protein